MRLPARLVEALLPERLRDLEVDVDPDQVHELERPHPEAAADPHDAVDLVVGGDPLAQQPQRLERERARARGWRRSRSRRRRESAPGPSPVRRRRPSASVSSEVSSPATTSTRRISGGRVEEVHAADPLGPLDPGGDRGHRERGGVGGEDRLRAADARPASRTGSRFSSRSSGAASITSSQSARSSSARRLAKAGRRRLGLGLRPATALGPSGQRRAKPSGASLERARIWVVEVGVEPPQAGELGDPGAHRPRPDDSDALDHGRASLRPTIGARCATARRRRDLRAVLGSGGADRLVASVPGLVASTSRCALSSY